MKRVVQVKLLPDAVQDQALRATLHACNHAANEVSQIARTRDIRNKRDLRQVTYGATKAIVPGAQAAQSVIRKVADAYTTHRANLRAGNYGKRGTDRYAIAAVTVITFRPEAAQPYDDRILSWDHQARTVSIWVTDTGTGTPGRLKNVAFTGHPNHLALLAAHRKGESDLLLRDGTWYLIATIDQDTPPVSEPAGFIGVDLGIEKIAATADETGTPGTDWSGGAVTARRKKNLTLRRKLQTKGTKSAKRLLKKRARKEARFARDVNHQISKQIVAEAKRTGRGIAVEELTGIRARVRHRKPQRATFHSWAFRQLGDFLGYKAEAAGVVVAQVDPAYTSQTCSACGVIDKKSRVTQADYACRHCGVSLNADTNAAINIARRGVMAWGAVNRPHAA